MVRTLTTFPSETKTLLGFREKGVSRCVRLCAYVCMYVSTCLGDVSVLVYNKQYRRIYAYVSTCGHVFESVNVYVYKSMHTCLLRPAAGLRVWIH